MDLVIAVASQSYDVFVSYSRLDSQSAAEIDAYIRANGLTTFFDRRSLAPGRPWMRALEQAIGAAKAVIVLIGPRGLGNTQQYEREFAIVRQSREPSFLVVPIILPGVTGDQPFDFLNLITWIDFSHARMVSEAPDELARLLAAIRGDPMAEPSREAICPYRGLDAFREEDATFFFGRGTEHEPDTPTGQLARKVRESPFVMVIGRSGSGKSSLVHAGLFPALRRDRERFWNVLSLRPGPAPLRALAAAFNPRTHDQGAAEYQATITREVEQLRTGDAEILSHMIREGLTRAEGAPDRLLLYVDQWEELYTQAPVAADKEQASRYADDVNHFIDLLLKATQTAPVTVVGTVRADFYDPLIAHSEIRSLLPTRQILLGAMRRSELESTIVEPARKVGIGFAPGVVQRILDEAGEDEGMLPLMQYALKEMWSLREGNTITGDSYAQSGGVREAIRITADRAFEALSAEEKQAARRLFLRLVTPGEGQEDTRARAAMPAESEQRRIIEQFAGPRIRLLVTGFDRARRPTVEVAHEALIRTWPQLRDWVGVNREKLRARAAILQAKQEWEEHERSEDLLLPKGFQLERARDLLEDPGDITVDDISSYIKSSLEADERERKDQEAREERERKAEQHALELEKQRLAQVAAAQAETTLAQRRARWALSGMLALVALVTSAGILVDRAAQQREAFVMAGAATRAAAEPTPHFERAMRVALHNLPKPIRPPWNLGWSAPEIRRLEANLAGAAQASRFLMQLGGFKAAIRSAEFSPNDQGRRVLTASDLGIVHVWDAKTGEKLIEIQAHDPRVIFAAFSPDGERIVSASHDGTARVWNARTGKRILDLKKHGKEVFDAKFSPNGAMIVTASKDGTARLSNAETGAEIRVLQGAPFVNAAFSPDGSKIVTASEDKMARVWNTHDGAELLPALTGHTTHIRTVAFSPDGVRIITASWDHTAKVWDAQSHAMLFSLEGHGNAVRSAAFSSDGRIISTSGDRTARIWDGKSPNSIRLQLNGHQHAVVSGSFSPDGKRAVTASQDGTARLWDVSDRWLSRIAAACAAPAGAITPDGSRIATACWNRGAIISDANNGAELAAVPHDGQVRSVRFDADGTRIATASSDRTARISDAKSGMLLHKLEHTAQVNSAAFDPTGAFLVTASDDGLVRLWNTRTGAEVGKFEAHKRKIWSALFDPTGSRIVTASDDRTARVWSTKGEPLAELKGHDQEVASAAFSSDGKRIVTASWDHTAQVWDAGTGEKLPVTVGHGGHIVFAAVFSPDDERIVTGGADNTVRAWDAATGAEISVLKGHAGKVRSVNITPDGKLLLTTGEDGTALLWDARWLVTSGRRLVQAVCQEKLVGHAQTFTLEDSGADAVLFGLGDSNVCAQR
jgi:WD40 repeat protein